MMDITVRLFAGLKCENKELACCGEKEFKIELLEELSLHELLTLLGIPTDLAKIVLVNSLLKPLTYTLTNGDEVSVFPPIGGG